MSESRFDFLKTLTEGERWVWLALRLEALSGRLREVQAAGALHDQRLGAVERRCSVRAWHGPALRALLAGLLGALAAAAAYLFDQLWSR
jgi:hypothetical protein